MHLKINTIYSIIEKQFPEYKNLIIKKVRLSGHDNQTFHLGNDFSLRFPSHFNYSTQVIKEHTFCKELQKNIPIQITHPIALGQPSDLFPYHFSINRWIEGEVVTHTNIDDKSLFAHDLACFLISLHQCDSKNGTTPGLHNFYRGGDLSVYHDETLKAIDNQNLFNKSKCLEYWLLGVNSRFNKEPVWIHGDVAVGNLLVRNGKLSAAIDFGNIAVGDPACDYVMAWTYFDHVSRLVFIRSLGLDKETIHRARAWALWKALISLNDSTHKEDAIYTLNEIFKEDV